MFLVFEIEWKKMHGMFGIVAQMFIVYGVEITTLGS